MNPPVLILILRVISALLLLSFLAVIAWFIYKDIRLVTDIESSQLRPQGTLRVLKSTVDSLQVDHVFELKLVTTIGRDSKNYITLDDDYASSKHALISWNGEQWILEDLNSRNGTLLNDLPLERQTVIVSGDVVSIGRTDFLLEM